MFSQHELLISGIAYVVDVQSLDLFKVWLDRFLGTTRSYVWLDRRINWNRRQKTGKNVIRLLVESVISWYGYRWTNLTGQACPHDCPHLQGLKCPKISNYYASYWTTSTAFLEPKMHQSSFFCLGLTIQPGSSLAGEAISPSLDIWYNKKFEQSSRDARKPIAFPVQ